LPRRQINLNAITDHELKMVGDHLNQTPRKCFGWKTPAELFKNNMLEQTERTRKQGKQKSQFELQLQR
jgi:IS30 family transposase